MAPDRNKSHLIKPASGGWTLLKQDKQENRRPVKDFREGSRNKTMELTCNSPIQSTSLHSHYYIVPLGKYSCQKARVFALSPWTNNLTLSSLSFLFYYGALITYLAIAQLWCENEITNG